MLKQFIDAIIGKKATLNLEKATVIFQEAKGRFDVYATKTVPFAIMATARALGAEVTLFAEGKEKATELEATRNAVVTQAAEAKKSGEEGIKQLEAQIAEIKQSIKTNERAAQMRVETLSEEKQAVAEVLDFFTL